MTERRSLGKRVQDAATEGETLARMKVKLAGIVPEAELVSKAELAFQINQLKRERNAVILGHNYMEPALYHSVPDHVGDSLQLARLCTRTDAAIIVFCGVLFMAETAKVLNPDKTVLIPSKKAGCSLAEGVTAEDVRKLKRVYPGAPVITYVNTYADVKAESDCCCTSGNAAAVVRRYLEQGHDRIIFLPDEFLAHNTANEVGAAFLLPPESLDDAPENAGVQSGRPTVIGCRTHCEVHELFAVEGVQKMRKQFPDVVILAHPECPPEVVELCDVAASTKGMLDYVRDVDAPRYLLLTECAMGDNVAAEFHNRQIVRSINLRCPHMEVITLEATLTALQKTRYKVKLAPDLIARAHAPIHRMLETV